MCHAERALKAIEQAPQVIQFHIGAFNFTGTPTDFVQKVAGAAVHVFALQQAFFGPDRPV